MKLPISFWLLLFFLRKLFDEFPYKWLFGSGLCFQEGWYYHFSEEATETSDFAQESFFIAPLHFQWAIVSDPLFIDEQRMAISPQKYFRILDKVRMRGGRPPPRESLPAGITVSPAPSPPPHTAVCSTRVVACWMNDYELEDSLIKKKEEKRFEREIFSGSLERLG